MKRVVMFAVFFATMMGIAASVAPASADQHKDNFRARCAREKCY
jgi:uncharacterized membrane protein